LEDDLRARWFRLDEASLSAQAPDMSMASDNNNEKQPAKAPDSNYHFSPGDMAEKIATQPVRLS
jgi:hypothetical protein